MPARNNETALQWFVMKALDAGLAGDDLRARVARQLGKKSAPPHTIQLAAAITCARAAVAGGPSDGTKRFQAFRMMLEGADNDAIVESLKSSPEMVRMWRRQLGWVAPAAAAARPKARAKAKLDWEERGTRPPDRRSRRSIWEFVVEMLAAGYSDIDEMALLAVGNVDGSVSRKSVVTVYSAVVEAKLALTGWVDDSQANRIARALMARLGNREVAFECDAPVTIVAGVRAALRIVDARRVPLDPTFHLQPASGDDDDDATRRPEGSAPPWAPPSAKGRSSVVPEGRGVGIDDATHRLIFEGKTNEEIHSELRRAFPGRPISLPSVASRRHALRKRLGTDQVPSDLQVRTVRGLKSSQGEASRARAKPPKPKAPPKPRSAPVKDAATTALLAGKTNDETLEFVRARCPSARTNLGTIAALRLTLRSQLGAHAIPSDAEVRASRQLPSPQAAGVRASSEGIGDFVRREISRGETNAVVLAKVLSKFPAAQTKMTSVRWHRSAMRKRDAAIPTEAQARRRAGR